jgi:hypothetical protein
MNQQAMSSWNLTGFAGFGFFLVGQKVAQLLGGDVRALVAVLDGGDGNEAGGWGFG